MSSLELNLLHQGPHAFKALLGRSTGESLGVLNAFRNPEGDLVASLHLMLVTRDDELLADGGRALVAGLEEGLGLQGGDLEIRVMRPAPEPAPPPLEEIELSIGTTALGDEGGRWTLVRETDGEQHELARLERVISEARTWTSFSVTEPALMERARALDLLQKVDELLGYDASNGEQLLEFYPAERFSVSDGTQEV